jgi:hypothetical protein
VPSKPSTASARARAGSVVAPSVVPDDGSAPASVEAGFSDVLELLSHRPRGRREGPGACSPSRRSRTQTSPLSTASSAARSFVRPSRWQVVYSRSATTALVESSCRNTPANGWPRGHTLRGLLMTVLPPSAASWPRPPHVWPTSANPRGLR